MAYLDQNEAFDHFRDRVLEGIHECFPIKGKNTSLHLIGLEVDDKLHPDDIRSQHQAKITGHSWAVPVYGRLEIRDNTTGHVVDTAKVRLAELPKNTNRYSHIVDGQEYQVDNQWQLKPGVYTRRKNNGELESQFNVAGRSAFKVIFDPNSKQFKMEYKKANLPLYPLLQSLGVKDEELKSAWGPDVFDANKSARRTGGAVEQFYKTSTGSPPVSHQQAEEYLARVLQDSKLRPEVTQVTLGKPFEHVTGDTLSLATKRLLDVQRGKPEDNRDSLTFKNLRSTGDFAYENIVGAKRFFQSKIQRQLNNPKTSGLRDVMRFDYFNEPVRQLFTKASISRTASQINPLEMVSSVMQTTIMGSGGIKSERSITDEAKMIDVSHLGFLDPINTPEGGKTGVTLRLPMGVVKKGNTPFIHVFNLKTGKTDMIDPVTFLHSKVVLPDQVTWKGGTPSPVSSTVKLVGNGNELQEGKFSDADYVFRHSSQLFNITSNLIPFMGNNSGGRAGMASRHMEQAISLLHREEPLVQVATPVKKAGRDTFERLLGHQVSHQTLVDGTVTKLKSDAVVIKDKDGQEHEVEIYNHYPLNDAKSTLHSTPIVKVGDTVSKHQIVADTNYSKNGTLALGTNLRVAYVPFKGYNFEDGVVISESAAKKLSSVHLQKAKLKKDDTMVFDPKQFAAKHSGVFKASQLDKVDADGVVKIGQKVQPGDPLIVAMKPYAIKDRQGLTALRKSLSGHHTDQSLRWDSEFEGEVVGVHKGADKIAVHVQTVEPMQVGDKIAGRYGNKGIVVLTLPDHEMPHSKDGKPVEVILNPSGVPGRMNIGQVLETAAAKIAKKTGKTYTVENFDTNTPDYLEKVRNELKSHGLSDTEELFDPVTKQPLGHALTGPQYMLKLVHQVEKKLSVRSGMGLPGIPAQEGYDLNLQPQGGGGSGGQSLSALGMFSLLAHGAKANIREFQTYKSEGSDPQTNPQKQWPSQHREVWEKIQEGLPLPPPQPTFAFKKFTDMLKGAGINIEKKGHEFVLSPLTDKHILKMSAGELYAADRSPVKAKLDKSGEFQPQPGGIFDEKLTGGHGGTKWSHLQLAEPTPNPVFENAIKRLTGLKQSEFDDVLYGSRGVDPTNGTIVESKKGITGGAGIKALLDRIDVKADLEKTMKALHAAPISKVDPLMKKAKYLRALQKLEMTPSEAYILHNIPVVPPVIRPLAHMQDGGVKYEDVNGLYMKFAGLNNSLKDPILTKNLTDKKKKASREASYDGIKALMGIGTVNKDQKERGFLEQIAGTQPKEGYFQKTLINRRQDLTMRSTIVPEPSLGLDEVGVPREAALTLFRPFVVRQLVAQGTASNPLQAQSLIAKVHKGTDDKMVWRALEQVMDKKPVLLKRDPALHKYSIQAFRPKMVGGNAIQIHPLVTGGFNADFDGDTMALYVPISHEAEDEAVKMFPSNNIFNEASGHVMYQPTLDGALGLYKLSLTGKHTDHKFKTFEEAASALKKGTVHFSDVVELDGKKTTPGRVLLASVLPPPMQEKVLHDFNFAFDKKGLSSTLTALGKNHPEEFGRIVDHIKDLGFNTSYGVIKTGLVPDKFISIGTHTLALKDFVPDKEHRDQILHETQKKVDAIYADTSIAKGEQERKAVNEWTDATKKMKVVHEKSASNDPSNLYLMAKAGVKPGWSQYQQMVIAPMIMQDSANRSIPLPVTKSYAEGLDMAGYWTQLHGARRGAVMKVQEVEEPGTISKLLMNTSMNLMVNNQDCGTTKGIHLHIGEKDVHDRYLAQGFKSGNLDIPSGTLLTPDIVGQIRVADKNAKVFVRSPLKCEEEKGLCQKCLGVSMTGHPHELGSNIGVQAAQAVGERAIQLTLKSFHGGGAQEIGGGSKILNNFDRFKQLTALPAKIPDAATLAMTSGTIDRIQQTGTGSDIWINGRRHFVGFDTQGHPLHQELVSTIHDDGYTPWHPPVVGMKVEAGQLLSDPNRTVINPHDLYDATRSMETVQNHLASEIHKLYKEGHNETVRRRMIETVVKAMSNLTKIVDAGDHENVLRGEFYPTSVINHMNRTAPQGTKPIIHEPTMMGVDMLPLSLQEDWMAKLQHVRLRRTLSDAASMGLASKLHQEHPIPGVAYGAEFGQPRLAKGTPNVASHHY